MLLGGGYTYFFMFIPIWRKISHFDSYFFRWVETTNQEFVSRGCDIHDSRVSSQQETSAMPMVSVLDGIPLDGSLNVWVLRLRWLIVQAASDVGQVEPWGIPGYDPNRMVFFCIKRKVF